MSGIAAIYHLDGRPVDADRLVQVSDRLSDRGGDSARRWVSGSIGLAHCAWRTVLEREVAQPIANERQTIVVTADMRIDNRAELCRLLDAGDPAGSWSDAELLLRAFDEWGAGCVTRLVGDFAFILWDATRRQLLCARDPFGIRPLYYQYHGGSFCCASDVEAVLAAGIAPRAFDLHSICDTLLNRSLDRAETHYQNTFRLLPGHSLVLSTDRLTVERYWDIDPGRSVRYRTDGEYVEHFREVWRAAVSARLRGGGSAGVLLSGGLDSSSVACTAQALELAQRHQPLETFSVIFDELPCDERSYIQAVVQKCGMRAHNSAYEQNESWLDFERLEDFPGCVYSPTVFMIGPALAQARERNVRTMLTGIGGDDLFASSPVHLTDLLVQRRYGRLLRQLGHDARCLSGSRWKLFREYCLKALVPGRARVVLRSLRRVRSGLPGWISAEFAGGCDSPGGWELDRAAQVRHTTIAQERIRQALLCGWNIHVALGRFEQFAARFGIECTHPFFDRRVVEFACAIPEEQRWFGPWRKVVLRGAMAGVVPDLVRLRRSKADFSPLVDREFNDRQADKVVRLIQSSILGQLGVVYVTELLELFDRYRAGKVSSADRLACHRVLGLELWCRWEMQHATAPG